MIKRLFVQISTSFSTEVTADSNVVDREATLRLATAVLMVDVARADHVFEESEFDRVLQLIESHFRLTPEQSAELVNAAGSKAEDMVSLYEFTQVLHKHLNDTERRESSPCSGKSLMRMADWTSTRIPWCSKSAICSTSAADG